MSDVDDEKSSFKGKTGPLWGRVDIDPETVAKLEKKLDVTVVLGGYVTRADELGRRLGTVGAAIREMVVEYESFARLRATESAMGPARVATLKEEVDTLEARERALQSLYEELEKEKRESESRLGVGRAGHGGGRKTQRGGIG